ncbi:MAG: alkaline phosphatase family protein [Zoogloeaceae bacterium]|nr:alkaline phosphatase family protein [Zoogloeaceae bacterium]
MRTAKPELPDGAIRPDYAGGGIVNLMRSLGDACGATSLPYAPLTSAALEKAGLDGTARSTARHIVLLLIDGLGYRYLQRQGAGGHLHRHLQARLTSVFPSTTTSAVTTCLTGLAPQQHALTGWHMYFSELDAIAAVLPLKPRGGGVFETPDALPERLFGYTPFAKRIARRCVFISPQAIAGSTFTRYHIGNGGSAAEVRGYQTLPELFAQTAAALREAATPAYIYAYYPELDALAHAHGIDSAPVAAQFAALDEAFGAFLADIAGSDTLVLACADHGFIDSPPERQIDLARHPALAATLARPLCGERRVAYCYVAPRQAARFEARAAAALGHCADIFSSHALIEQGWFGPGAANPRLASRIGDYVIVMRENWTLLDWMAGEARYRQIGVHGGLSADEMHVPLIAARCDA